MTELQFTNILIGGVGSLLLLVIGILGYIGSTGLSELRSIHTSVNLISERIGKLETWVNLHEKSDDERHREITYALKKQEAT